LVRALGLEPSLFRGKSPVPYLSGVTRMRGPARNRTPYVGDGWVTTSVRAMRDRPMSKSCGDNFDDDASVVVNVQSAALEARRDEAGPEGVEPSARGFGIRSTTTGSSP